MIHLPTIFVANGAAVMLLLTVFINLHKKMHHSLPDDKMFYAMMDITVIQCVLESATFCLDGKPGTAVYVALLVLNVFLYINNICFAFFWTVYADYKLFADAQRIYKRYPYVAVPAAIICIGAVCNLVVPVFFTITAQNTYARTGLYLLPYVITYAYLLYGVGLIYRYRDKVGKYLFMPALLFMVPIMLGSVLQFLFYGLSLVWLGVSIALVSLYINVQNEISYTDDLSRLYTRQYMTQYLATATKQTGKQVAGAMIDLDGFKGINDTFGHLTGDDAIACFGQVLRSALPKGTLGVRYAGDEFMEIMTGSEMPQMEATMQAVKAAAKNFNQTAGKPYTLAFSYGVSAYDKENDTIDTFFARMDAAMYENKKNKVETSVMKDRRQEPTQI